MKTWLPTEPELADEFAAVEDFSLTAFPAAVLTALRNGLESVAVKLAIAAGHRDENKLTNLIFNVRHPERAGRPLATAEPDFSSLSAEWLDIRDRLVRPNLTPSTAPSSKSGAGPLALVDTPMPSSGPGYTTSGTSYKYGVPETIAALKAIAIEWHRKYPDIRFMVRDVSRRGGGKFGTHASHRIGLDADVQLWIGGQKVCMSNASYPTWRPYVQALVSVIRSNPILNIKTIGFTDPKIKDVSNWAGHTCHLHIRFCMPSKYASALDLNLVYKSGEEKPSYSCKSSAEIEEARPWADDPTGELSDESETVFAFEDEQSGGSIETSTFSEDRSPPLLGCPDAVGDLGVLRNALAVLTKRLNRSPLDRNLINNARLDFVAAARQIIQNAKGGSYVRRGCKKGNLLSLVKGIDRLRSGLAETSSRLLLLNTVTAAVTKAAQSAPRGEEMDGELGAEPASELEWTEEELQYSIINSPTSPGDDRFRITARATRPSTLMFPFNTICLLERHHLDGKTVSRVTGTLIAPQVVLTAKHCLTRLDVKTAAEGPRFKHIVVSPGADLSATSNARPADPPSITAPAAFFRVHPTLDFGVIILPKAFRRPVQFMRLQPRGDANTATLLTIAGYPCDKPQGTMWGHSDKIRLADVTSAHLRYTIDTCPGHSGSPIWLLGNNAIRLLLGVHTDGPAGCVNDPKTGSCQATGAPVTPVGGLNGGVRVTCAVIDQITAWCREFRVTPPTIDSFYQQRCTK